MSKSLKVPGKLNERRKKARERENGIIFGDYQRLITLFLLNVSELFRSFAFLFIISEERWDMLKQRPSAKHSRLGFVTLYGNIHTLQLQQTHTRNI